MTTLRDVDDDFAEVRARSHVLVGRVHLVEAEHFVDHWFDPVGRNGPVHRLEHLHRADRNALHVGAASENQSRVEFGRRPLKPPIKLILPPSRIAPKERVRVCPHLCNPHRFDSHAVVAHCWLGGPREELEPPGLSPSSPRPDLASWGLLTRWAGLFRLACRRCRRADDRQPQCRSARLAVVSSAAN
jgi:hypothetical protein